MNLKPWLDRREIQQVTVTKKSLEDLVKLINRDLADSQVVGISPDRRFSTAYNAALNLSGYVIRKQGYRVLAKVGHHHVTLEIARHILGKKAHEFLDYFNLCRIKRNKIDYDLTDVVSEIEVEELISEVLRYKDLVLFADD